MLHETNVKVRFTETDALGHVNNVSYFIYLEQGRVEFLESLGCKMELDEWSFILAHIECDFVQQAYFNQNLTVGTAISKIGTKSLRMYQTIFDSETRQEVAKGESVLIFFDFKQQKSEALPVELVEKLKLYSLPEQSMNHGA